MDAVRLVFALPGTSFTANNFLSFTRLLHQIPSCGLDVSYIITNGRSSNVAKARELCLGCDPSLMPEAKLFEQYNFTEYTHILWIDSDVTGFSIEHLKKMLEADKDIITGLYRRSPNEFCLSQDFNLQTFELTGSLPWMDSQALMKIKELVFEVAHAGMGFMLVKAGVLEKIIPPRFESRRISASVAEAAGEDVCFCETARALGFGVWAHKDVVVGHEKMAIM